MRELNCFIVGDSNLTLECAKLVYAIGHKIEALITESQLISSWAQAEDIKVLSPEIFQKETHKKVDCLFIIEPGNNHYNKSFHKALINIFYYSPNKILKNFLKKNLDVTASEIKEEEKEESYWIIQNGDIDNKKEFDITYYKGKKGEENEGFNNLVVILSRENDNLEKIKLKTFQRKIPPLLYEKIISIAKKLNLKISDICCAVFFILLGRYTNKSLISVISPLTSHIEFNLVSAGCMGHLIDIGTESDFLEILNNIKTHKQNFSQFNLQYIEKQADNSNSEIENLGFLLNAGVANFRKENELSIKKNKDNENSFFTACSDVLLQFCISSKEISFNLFFKERDILNNYVNYIYDHFLEILTLCTSDLNKKAFSFPIVKEKEENFILEHFSVPFHIEISENIQSVFEKQVQKFPENKAIVQDNTSITYEELDKKSNIIAHKLKLMNLKHEQLVGICLDRSIESIATILGILKAGGAYVPIDLEFPDDRIKFIFQDTNMKYAFVYEKDRDRFSSLVGSHVKLIEIESCQEIESSNAVGTLSNKYSASQLAYVIYTSGSTGKPKGVAINHESVVNVIEYEKNFCKINYQSKILNIVSLSFDAAGWDIYGALFSGATLYLPSDNIRKSSLNLFDYIKDNKISHITLTPSLLSTFPQKKLPELECIVAMGELSDKKVLSFWSKTAFLINGYGPTETTIATTLYPYKDGDSATKIGKPIQNTKLYILDQNMFLQPVGVPGELYIAGKGLARGYYNNDALTNEKFFKNKFSTDRIYEKIYKTGDLVKWLPDGNIDFIGRVDNQVKIRGFRVELEEIEDQIQSIPFVAQAVVSKFEKDEQAYLVAYFTINKKEVDNKDINYKEIIKSKLQKILPSYMIPNFLMQVNEFQLSVNGKIEKKKLPEPTSRDLLSGSSYVAPENEFEKKLTVIFEKILKVDKMGVHDNFLELGLHSLTAGQIIGEFLEKLKIKTSIKELFKYPTISKLSTYLYTKESVDEEQDIKQSSLSSSNIPHEVPLSYAQQRLWFLYYLEGSSATYNLPLAFKMIGDLDIHILEKSFNILIERHEALRTVFKSNNGVPYQQTLNKLNFKLDKYKIKEEELDRSLLKSASESFDLENGPLVRVVLYELRPQEHVLVITQHNIITDGWSSGILLKELNKIYLSLLSKKEFVLPKIRKTYAQYSINQRNLVENNYYSNQLSYWKEKLSNLNDLNLPSDFIRPSIQLHKGDKIFFELKKEIKKELDLFCKKTNSTLYMLLMACFNIILSKYSAQEDIVIGTGIANRNDPSMAHTIGFFVNLIPFRSNLSGNLTFSDFLKQINQNCLEAYENQDIPFDRLVEALKIPRNNEKNPIFQIMFFMQNANDGFCLSLPKLQTVPLPIHGGTSMMDLSLNISELDDKLEGYIEYDTALYKKERIQRLIEHFSILLEKSPTLLENKVNDINILSVDEQKKLKTSWNSTEDLLCKGLNLKSEIEKQVKKTPNKVALVFENKMLTYDDLNKKSNQLAYFIRSKYLDRFNKEMSPNTGIAICTKRNINAILSILSTIKAGGAYIPIAPEYPIWRLNYLFTDSQPKVIFADDDLEFEKKELLNKTESIVIYLDDKLEFLTNLPSTNLNIKVGPDSLAYIAYTSGSTGAPKGVQVRHSSVMNIINSLKEFWNFTETDKALSVTTINFDIFGADLYVPLTSGGECILCPFDVIRDPNLFVKYFKKTQPTFLQSTPSFMNMIVDYLPKLAHAMTFICGGEAVPDNLIEKLMKFNGNIFNAYGPTETTIWSTCKKITSIKENNIGKPLSNNTCFVLDSNKNMVPVGIPGELYIGGYGLSPGYLNNPSLTKEKFIDLPLITDQKLYKTGDMVYWSSEGDLNYIGRADFQVKIRGARIELEEIQHILLENPHVKEGIISTYEDNFGNKNIIAYYTVSPESRGHIQDEDIRKFLLGKLPDPMIPSAFMQLEKMPLNNNGKIDRSLLPKPSAIPRHLNTSFEAPRNDEEKILVDIWEKILNVSTISIKDNFFNLGGNSLTVPQTVSLINNELGLKLTLRDFMSNPTIYDLSNLISNPVSAPLKIAI